MMKEILTEEKVKQRWQQMEEMNAINGININSRLRYDPDNCDFSIL